MRETSIGFIEGIGRLLGGALAPFIMAFLLDGFGVSVSYVFVASVAVLGALAVGALGTETRGRSLEQVSELADVPEAVTSLAS